MASFRQMPTMGDGLAGGLGGRMPMPGAGMAPRTDGPRPFNSTMPTFNRPGMNTGVKAPGLFGRMKQQFMNPQFYQNLATKFRSQPTQQQPMPLPRPGGIPLSGMGQVPPQRMPMRRAMGAWQAY